MLYVKNMVGIADTFDTDGKVNTNLNEGQKRATDSKTPEQAGTDRSRPILHCLTQQLNTLPRPSTIAMSPCSFLGNPEAYDQATDVDNLAVLARQSFQILELWQKQELYVPLLCAIRVANNILFV